MGKQSKLHEAVKYLRRAILLDPDFKLPYIVLSSCFMQLEQFQEALDSALIGLQRHHDSTVMKYNAGQATYHLIRLSDNPDIEDSDQQRARSFLDYARRKVPEQWT